MGSAHEVPGPGESDDRGRRTNAGGQAQRPLGTKNVSARRRMKLSVPLRRSFSFPRRSVAVFLTALLGCCVAANSPSVMAQAADQRRAPMPSSELGRENLSRVSASAGEIKMVLVKDTGLMVALKYWVAKDATEHGQIISESDLTNDAIFERLEEDAQFRSVATALVQRYGYLLPKLNPQSEVAKEHDLLVQERTK